MTQKSTFRWRFFRGGGFEQALIETPEELASLEQLDPKLWAALACPVQGLELDERTLSLIDGDGDGRIRVPEIRKAVHWTLGMLKDGKVLFSPGDELNLDFLSTESAEAQAVKAVAIRTLMSLQRPAGQINVADATVALELFNKGPFNGDGVVTKTSAADNEALSDLLNDILTAVGGVVDRSGEPGVDNATLEKFQSAAEATLAWWKTADEEVDSVRKLGDETEAAHGAWQAVKAKVDDYFTRCRLSAYDERAVAALNRTEADFATMAGEDFSTMPETMAAFPLARVAADGSLPLKKGMHPAWHTLLGAFRDKVVVPLLGDLESLTDEQWQEICAALAPFDSWLSARPEGGVHRLGTERVQAILTGSEMVEIKNLIEKDLEMATEAGALENLEQIVRYRRDLVTLVNNFVNFRDFFGRKKPAVFQSGTLYIDGRSCDFCLPVADAGKHAAVALRSQACLLYLNCTRRDGTPGKLTIAAAVTDGDLETLMVGRNGVYFDRQGRDWDATVVKIIENPISIRQAFWSPYRKAARLISEQMEKFAAAKEKSADAALTSGVTGVTGAVEPAKKPAPFDMAKFVGIFAAVGLAIGAIGTALSALVTGFMQLAVWQMPLAIGGLMLLISGPAMLMAWLKLRQRNIAPILDANGWAVNTQARLTVRFGESLTAVATLPPGSYRSVGDPFEQESNTLPKILLFAVIIVLAGLLWKMGAIPPVCR